jgi:hypothetical protein
MAIRVIKEALRGRVRFAGYLAHSLAHTTTCRSLRWVFGLFHADAVRM